MSLIKIKYVGDKAADHHLCKRDEDAGYDIYTTEKEEIILQPGDTHMFPTGIYSSFSPDY